MVIASMKAPTERRIPSHATGDAAPGVMFDAFKKLDGVRVAGEPFPHVVIEDVLPAELGDQLIKQMPPIEVLTAGNAVGSNKRFNLSCAQAQTAAGVSAVWRDVLVQGSSQQFLDRVLALFGARRGSERWRCSRFGRCSPIRPAFSERSGRSPTGAWSNHGSPGRQTL
jgi:hypothetical protein